MEYGASSEDSEFEEKEKKRRKVPPEDSEGFLFNLWVIDGIQEVGELQGGVFRVAYSEFVRKITGSEEKASTEDSEGSI